jgi:hypothetical protein
LFSSTTAYRTPGDIAVTGEARFRFLWREESIEMRPGAFRSRVRHGLVERSGRRDLSCAYGACIHFPRWTSDGAPAALPLTPWTSGSRIWPPRLSGNRGEFVNLNRAAKPWRVPAEMPSRGRIVDFSQGELWADTPASGPSRRHNIRVCGSLKRGNDGSKF